MGPRNITDEFTTFADPRTRYASQNEFLLSVAAIVTLLENSKDSSDQYARTVAFLRKGNSFGVSPSILSQDKTLRKPVVRTLRLVCTL